MNQEKAFLLLMGTGKLGFTAAINVTGRAQSRIQEIADICQFQNSYIFEGSESKIAALIKETDLYNCRLAFDKYASYGCQCGHDDCPQNQKTNHQKESDRFRKFAVTDVQTVEEFVAKYYKRPRITTTIVQTLKAELDARGWCFISRHESNTGECVAFYLEPKNLWTELMVKASADIDAYVKGQEMNNHFEKLAPTENSYICDMCLDVDYNSNVQAVYKSKAKHDQFRGKNRCEKFPFPRPVVNIVASRSFSETSCVIDK